MRTQWTYSIARRCGYMDVHGTKGIEYDFEVKAARLGSSLDAVIQEFKDSTGKRLVEADDSQGIQTDAKLRWAAHAADGEFAFTIRDRLANATVATVLPIAFASSPRSSPTSNSDGGHRFLDH